DLAQGGLGIGLSLVKSIVEMHGGTVKAESNGLGSGSEFTVRLPPSRRVVAVASCTAGTGAHSSLHRARLRILLVDDNRAATDAMAQLLRLSGHVVCVAYCGEDALQAAMACFPPVVLLD